MRHVHLIKETARGSEISFLEDSFFKERQIFLTEQVDAETTNELIKQLLYLNSQDSGKEITLYINSPGGEVSSGLAVYDTIRLIDAPVRTVCTGTAASMGAILFLAGEKREMLPHTKIMIHDPSFINRNIDGMKPHDMQNMMDDIMQIRDVLCDIIVERTGRTLDEVTEKTKTDSYFSSDEAVNFGLATSVIDKL